MAMNRVVKVSEQHLWVGGDDQHVQVGLTNFIQSELGTVISVELPEVGDKMEKGEAFAEVESVATVHELISPVSGTVSAVNANLEEQPSVINEDPYNEGWLVEVRLKNEAEIDSLMDMDEYYHFVFDSKS
ncbi:MAG TPA: glycine cleavage system protein GcvH [Candidatus Binatia bacterium]